MTKQKILTLVWLVVILVIIIFVVTAFGTKKSSVSVTIPNTPIISDIRANDLTAASTIISWTTDVPTQSELTYIVKGNVKSAMEVKDPTQSTKHTVEVTHLNPKTTYSFAIKGIAESGKFTIVTGEFTKL